VTLERLLLACSLLLPNLAACDAKDEASPTNAADLQPGKTAASLRLDAVVALVEGDSLADAKALEIQLNDPAAKLHAIDLDADGKTDFVDVIERRKAGKTTLELRAIPSSEQESENLAKVSVVVATIELEPTKEHVVVHATYSEHIEHDATIHVYHHEIPATYENGVLVVASGCFFHYAFVVEHEVYVGHHHVYVDHHVHIEHKKHKKHKHHKHKGKHKGHGHGGHGVVVTW
jgi:cytochrome c-type biogenesis protein CcmE